MTINNLFHKYELTDIDILFLDAEGFDDRIIKDIDFSQFMIRNIYYENVHIDNQSITEYLQSLGYSVKNGTKFSIHNSLAVLN
jgi:hypothetical protein